MVKHIGWCLVLLLSVAFHAPTASANHKVSGHFNSKGHYVRPHVAKNPTQKKPRAHHRRARKLPPTGGRIGPTAPPAP